MGTEILSRITVRDSIKPTDVGLNAYSENEVFTRNEDSVLPHRFDYDVNPDSTIIIYPELPETPTFDTAGVEMDRRLLNQSPDIIAFTTIPSFSTTGIKAQRIGLPVLSDIDTVQLIIRAGAFVLDFIGEPRLGLPPHGVQFENKSQSPIENWLWDFGDGNTSNDRDPFHVYVEEGLYTVSLRAGSPVFGFQRKTKVDYINVGIILLIDPYRGKAPLRVSFAFDQRILN